MWKVDHSSDPVIIRKEDYKWEMVRGSWFVVRGSSASAIKTTKQEQITFFHVIEPHI